jgi:hypothetical protein
MRFLLSPIVRRIGQGFYDLSNHSRGYFALVRRDRQSLFSIWACPHDAAPRLAGNRPPGIAQKPLYVPVPHFVDHNTSVAPPKPNK